MDKQQEQTKQNPNQEVEYISGFLEDEEVNESDFDEPTGEQEARKLAAEQQKKPEGGEQPRKAKRPRKTIEQEIAELDARREKLIEKKRRQETHEKIVFGGAIITMLLYLKKTDNNKFDLICNNINNFITNNDIRNKEIIDKIILNIKK